MGKYFGTDGFRGEANKDLTAEKAFKVGRYLGWYYGRMHEDGKAQIAIGKDTRRSSYMLEDALSAGLTSSGADVYLLHVTTTPSVSYVVRTENFDCGIMISASHNPFYDNGIKIMRSNGQKIEPEIEDQIEEYIDGKALPRLPRAFSMLSEQRPMLWAMRRTASISIAAAGQHTLKLFRILLWTTDSMSDLRMTAMLTDVSALMIREISSTAIISCISAANS